MRDYIFLVRALTTIFWSFEKITKSKRQPIGKGFGLCINVAYTVSVAV